MKINVYLEKIASWDLVKSPIRLAARLGPAVSKSMNSAFGGGLKTLGETHIRDRKTLDAYNNAKAGKDQIRILLKHGRGSKLMAPKTTKERRAISDARKNLSSEYRSIRRKQLDDRVLLTGMAGAGVYGVDRLQKKLSEGDQQYQYQTY